MLCTTVLHGGVCHRTSTPHKSGNKMKEKKKKNEIMRIILDVTNDLGLSAPRSSLHLIVLLLRHIYGL